MFFAAMNSTSFLDGSFVLNGVVQWMERPINKAEIVIVMTLTSYIFMSIFKSKEKSPEKKVAVQKDPAGKTLKDYSFRDLFHFFINQEFHTDKLHLAKEFSERMHAEASEYMKVDHADNPDFPDHFTYIPYDKVKVDEKLDYIFDRLFKEKYLDWCQAGQPVTPDSPQWWAQTKLHLKNYLIQREPYHLTDGTWLRGVPQGPMSSIQAKLFSIYIDELGNGDPDQNHCNVYLDVLQSLGLQVPPITSREFVDQPSILDISFKKPALTLTTSLFPQTYEPEILGYTLWLETTSAAEHAPLRKILERYGLNSKFSLLHTAIDNNVNGHGRYARDAVEQYLDHIQQTEGEDAVEQYWKRIWTGYVAYGMTGNSDEELRRLCDKQIKLTARDEFIDMLKQKGEAASKMHGQKRLGTKGELINDLFLAGDAERLCQLLENSKWVVKGDPSQSKLLSEVITFHGPMYQIFDADELTIIARWILALKPSPLNNMIGLVLQRRKLGQRIKSDMKLQLPNGSEKLLRNLFEGAAGDLLSAFCASQWTVAPNAEKISEDNVDKCQFMVSINRLGVLEHVFNLDGEDKKTVRAWLLAGAPVPAASEEDNALKIQSHERFKFQY